MSSSSRPSALNPIMARLAEEAGFKAVYLSGGSLGWMKCVTEANLSLSELAEVAVDMRAACKLPIVLDAGGGWGDPVHVHRTIALAEVAGFAAIEIEDQLLPRRVEHHVGIDHLVPTEFMLKKLKEAVAARTDPGLMIIARTNARRVGGLDEALRRSEAFHKAGADMIFCYTRNAEEMRKVGERLPPPLMMFAPADGFSAFGCRNAIAPRSAIGSPPRPALHSPPCTRRCGNPISVSRRTRWTRSSDRAAPTADESRTGHLRARSATGDRTPHDEGPLMAQDVPIGSTQMGFAQLNERSREIFRQVVESYLATGEPVGSRNISRLITTPLSPASVRNVMSDLEQLGLVYAPHTSAGRLPDRARTAVLRRCPDGDRRPRRKPIGAPWRPRSRPPASRMERDPHRGLRHAVGSHPRRRRGADAKSNVRLKHIEFVRLEPERALVVLVAEDGQVENRVLDVPAGLPTSALTEAANFLNAHVRGRTLAEAEG